MATLSADWDRMVTSYEFPAAHWQHLRTTNVVESPFAAVRLRTTAAKRFRQVANATALGRGTQNMSLRAAPLWTPSPKRKLRPSRERAAYSRSMYSPFR